MQPPEFLPETQQAIATALKAAEAVMDVYSHDFSVDVVNGQPVTEADRRSNALIQAALANTGYPILSEESPDDSQRLTKSNVWIVDPLDGTSDFVNKTGDFSVMIGLVENQVPVLGVVYKPVGDELYVAEAGRGAYVKKEGQWQQLKVSQVAETSSAKAVMSRHHLSDTDKAIVEQLGVSQYLQRGSCGLKVAAVASGEAELYFTSTSKIKQWDTCAAFCLVTEAGGIMTDLRGQPLLYNTEKVNHQYGILVSNGKIITSTLNNR